MIRLYGRKFDYPWLTVTRIKHSLTFEELLNQQNAILLLDEAGVEIFSRSWKERKKQELDSLFRIRHYKNKLLYAAQDWTQVDVQFRRMTHICLWIRGFQYYSAHSDPVLVSRLILYFDPPKFDDFMNDPMNKVKVVNPIVRSGFRYTFNIIKADKRYKYLFACYNSFDQHRTRKKLSHVHKYIEYDPDFTNQINMTRINRDFNLNDLL